MRQILLILLMVATACTAQPATDRPTVTSNAPTGVEARVLHVYDGDTFLARADGRDIKVRLIGVNTPEHDECFGKEAGDALARYLDEETVTLVTDVEPYDQYGRLLAYVYVDGVLVNEWLAAEGYALARAYDPNVTLQPVLDDAMAEAREAERGLWASTACASSEAGVVAISDLEPNPPGPDEDHLNDEWVRLTNRTSHAIDLSGWHLRDGSSVHRYVFPDGFVLPAGASVTIHTGCGEPSAGSDLYWCESGPVWDNGGDIAILSNASEQMVDTFAYPSR